MSEATARRSDDQYREAILLALSAMSENLRANI